MGSLSSLEILLVEDSERVRKAIQTLLKKSRYSVEALMAKVRLISCAIAILIWLSQITRWLG